MRGDERPVRPGGDHLADGLTDDIIIALGRAGQVPVISRTSTASLKQPTPALQASVVVEGTQKVNDGTRVKPEPAPMTTAQAEPRPMSNPSAAH